MMPACGLWLLRLVLSGGAMAKELPSKASVAAKVLSILRRTGYGDDLEVVEVLGPVQLPWCNWTIGTLPADVNCAIILNRIVAELQAVYDLRIDDAPR